MNAVAYCRFQMPFKTWRYGLVLVTCLFSPLGYAAEPVEAVKTIEVRRYRLPEVPRAAYTLPPRPTRYEPDRGCPFVEMPRTKIVGFVPYPDLGLGRSGCWGPKQIWNCQSFLKRAASQKNATLAIECLLILVPSSNPHNPKQMHILMPFP